ncbi:Glucose-6-phosphate 1-dehydrogenase [Zhongshania aliphaticivorans]|uniref:Glucose-6-phosphate 1-dehydrogenase n=1 Tax=Zhongshania aliphaticivorans TaxID=1470434 RepID=A0A5S9P5K3_9GAMM|nr:glucose-6-phosphate dehydrogenase [Zhongshania aliphaticivorans]CAA0091113.1 Glucose-6-phosphate 1-dehydrogenase [Zhongshania aliphaticivorans]CAA0098592.1 Glucose-6-phosphate 1-dehydrogenase [Zhongshania aliphaticivorans]
MNNSSASQLVIFGGTGDLALRKLQPALYKLQREGLLDDVTTIIALGRSANSNDNYRSQVKTKMQEFLPKHFWSEQHWQAFAAKLRYISLDVNTLKDYHVLADAIHQYPNSRTVFYLATLSTLYTSICRNLHSIGVVDPRSSVVLEKPLGHDLASCTEINHEVLQVFPESNIFRIDHYLGKETVQNLLVLRFGNALFGPLWNSQYIDNIQITVAEDIGVEGRGNFYAKTGALRDMVQNHILQLLCLVAMEPPANLRADTIRDEKVKVLQALRPITVDNVKAKTVRGQYTAGVVKTTAVSAFLDEAGFEDSSNTETFVALQADVHNWRWEGTPFYLRTGKRLTRRYSEIIVELKKHPFSLFEGDPNDLPNKLVIRLQPEENITLYKVNKKPGLGRQLKLEQVELNLDADIHDELQAHEAYERLLLDVLEGDQTLFMRRDEVEACWAWVDSIIDAWQNAGTKAKPYSAGSMGPNASLALPEKSGRSWHE